MTEDEDERLDPIKLFYGVLFILFFVGVLFAAAYFFDWLHNRPYVKSCAENPRLLYTEKCGEYEECLQACVQRLKDGAS